MQLLVRGDRTCVVEVAEDASVRTVLETACARKGSMPARAARLVHGGRALDLDASVASCGIESGSTLHLVSRLRGGAVTVRPRVQRERWSLYWKETMATATDLLDEVVLEDVSPDSATPADLLKQLAKRQGWPAAEELLSLEGFEGPWERVLFQGRELDLAKTLADQGVPDGADLTAVRLALVAEGWKIKSDDADLSSSSEEEDSFAQVHPHQRKTRV